MTFTANGKEINTFFQVEPNTKLFPAVFVLPTTQNVLQFELGKLKNIMPISAAMFSSERQNPAPQCPPPAGDPAPDPRHLEPDAHPVPGRGELPPGRAPGLGRPVQRAPADDGPAHPRGGQVHRHPGAVGA
ncbi:ryanodine receptor 1-like [Neopelma chrysocephalum]|uniref:ryanodine receptor 1-like n=1 Tax=Neopelma chrysocephalum TaxID=114329 RepID=UPI000FCD031E|nr:ryanodine receptor 1-like [Neopelma chrysocephalum]